MLRYAKLYVELHLANIRSRSAYPFNFFMGVFAVTMMGLAKLAGVWVITERVPLIDGYSFDELVFLFTLWPLPHSIFIIGFRHVWSMDYWVRNGMFDRFLVRPLKPVVPVFDCAFRNRGIRRFARRSDRARVSGWDADRWQGPPVARVEDNRLWFRVEDDREIAGMIRDFERPVADPQLDGARTAHRGHHQTIVRHARRGLARRRGSQRDPKSRM